MNHINTVEVCYRDQRVGRLVLSGNSLCAFEYDNSWLETGFSISPFELPLTKKIYLANRTPFDGNFGVFDDSMPDGWGMLILDRYLRTKGINLLHLNNLERLSIVGTSGRGALEFFPDCSVKQERSEVNLEQLSIAAGEILKVSDYHGEGIEEFQERGGSPGGARPKIFLNYEGKEWLIKFRAQNDPENIGETEYKYSLLAKKCGVIMPETKLFDNRYFGVERFDRKASDKLHVVSVAGLLRADYRIPSIDYYHIFQVGKRLTNDAEEIWKIFRLMVFNYLIENKDDHAKNFAFIYDGEKWLFAPAFDLLPSEGFNGYHTTSINDSIQPVKEDLISLGVKAGLDKRASMKVYSEMEEIIKTSKI